MDSRPTTSMYEEGIHCPCLGDIRIKSAQKQDGETPQFNLECTCGRRGFIRGNRLFYEWVMGSNPYHLREEFGCMEQVRILDPGGNNGE